MPKPTLTQPPTTPPDKHGQYPVDFDVLMEDVMGYLCGPWFIDAQAVVNYMQATLDAASTATTNINAAIQAKQDAEAARTQAQTAATSAGQSATTAGGQAGAAAGSAGTANSAALLAQDWAAKENNPVASGLYSAKYYALQAYQYAQQAAGGGEPSIPVSTTDKWFRGDKTWQVLPVATISAAGTMSSADKLKLNNVAEYASANFSDAYLLNRANHTGTQAISTVTGLQTALDTKAGLVTPTLTAPRGKVGTIVGSTLNLATGERFAAVQNGSTTYAISNPPAAGEVQVISFKLTVNSGTPTFWAGTKWHQATQPQFVLGAVTELVAQIEGLVGGGTSTIIGVVQGDSR